MLSQSCFCRTVCYHRTYSINLKEREKSGLEGEKLKFDGCSHILRRHHHATVATACVIICVIMGVPIETLRRVHLIRRSFDPPCLDLLLPSLSCFKQLVTCMTRPALCTKSHVNPTSVMCARLLLHVGLCRGLIDAGLILRS